MKISKTLKIDRVYYDYRELEEYEFGMWKRPTGERRKLFINRAADLMRCADEFKEAMARAVKIWPKSCQHNLTSLDSNRIAWLGHAGCCVAANSPEECTRVAWHTLTADEQNDANRVAAEVLQCWDDENGDRVCSKTQLELMF